MHKFVRNLLTEWRKLKLSFTGETILIAVSGGADSVSLALALAELRKAKKITSDFVIGHFNHDLRGSESRRDAEFVEYLADKLNFKFIGGIQDPNSKLKYQKGNLEQLARRARYDFLEKTAVSINADKVLTAHTLNDQAETFLLRLIRGSGSDGLGGMKTISQIPNPNSEIKLVRPLLSWAKREDTEDFCRSQYVNFRQDAMNDDLDFSRVRVRKELIPLLKSFNPQIIERIVNTTFLLQEDSIELNSSAKILLEKSQSKDGKSIKIRYLTDLPRSLRQRTIRLWILQNNFDLRQITLKHIEAIDKLMFSKKSGRNIELPNGIIIVKNDGKLLFEKSRVEKSPFGN